MSAAKKFSYEGPAGRCSVRILPSGRVLETRRDGKTFISDADLYGEWYYISTKEQRKWATEAEWRASLPAGTVVTGDSPALAVPPAPADPEAVFRQRAFPHCACLIVPGPSAKDLAWEARDRAAYDAADATPGWKLSEGNCLWLAVEHGGAFAPVCRNSDGVVLRFFIDDKLLTFAEAGVSADAVLWKRKSDADPTLIRVV